jgi:hypothetical protein
VESSVVARSKLRTRLLTAGVVGVVVAELVAEEADATAAKPPTRCLQMGWDSGVRSSLAMLSGSDVGGVVVETGEAETAMGVAVAGSPEAVPPGARRGAVEVDVDLAFAAAAKVRAR